jgi:hypothetical protein
MTQDGNLNRWNRWYDSLPQEWRFHFVLWPLLILGALNMLLSVGGHFPFGLLLLLGILAVAAIRVPYVLERLRLEAVPEAGSPGAGADERFLIEADWINDLNERYEAMPESRQIWVPTVILLVAGALNMLLTIYHGFPFGLLFLLALLAIVAVRGPYSAGWVRPRAVVHQPAPAEPGPAELPHAATPAIGLDPASVSPVEHDGGSSEAPIGHSAAALPHSAVDEPPALHPHSHGSTADSQGGAPRMGDPDQAG